LPLVLASLLVGRVLGVVGLIAFVGLGWGGAVPAGAAPGPLAVSGGGVQCLLPGANLFTWQATSSATEALTIDSVTSSGTIIQGFSPNPVPAGGSSTTLAGGTVANGNGETVTITITYHGATTPTSTAMGSIDLPPCHSVCTPYPQCFSPPPPTESTTTAVPASTHASVLPTTAHAALVSASPAFTG
jgi:hypothetical protein